MDKLWSTFALARDGLYTWTKFCSRYIDDEVKLKEASTNNTPRQREDDLSSASGLRELRDGEPLTGCIHCYRVLRLTLPHGQQ